MNRKTALHDEHVAAGAKMVGFAGWEMPLHYGSQVAEHHAVRAGAGVFDVSHLTVIDVTGADAPAWLRGMLAGDPARIAAVGGAQYNTLLNDSGGIIDDLIAYRMRAGYRLVANAATRAKVLAWLKGHLVGAVGVAEVELAILAVQGPNALTACADIAPLRGAARLARFHAADAGGWMLARTGYTGEDGLEILLPQAQAPALWRQLLAAGARPAGLAARDTLRLEAGLNLYGQDMDETVSPLASNLGWTVHWQPESRGFIGRRALERERAAGVSRKLTGLALAVKGVMRAGQQVLTEAGSGTVTSGLFSPTLGYSIALARLPVGVPRQADVLIRGRRRPARIVRPPFVNTGREKNP